MTITQLATWLVERDAEDDLVKVFADRLVLRVFTTPSLLLYLSDLNIDEDFIELNFHHLPEQVVQDVLNLIAVKDTKVYKFKKDGHPHIAFRINAKSAKDAVENSQKARGNIHRG